MAREYFHAYHSHLEAMKSLNDAERGRLYTAMLEYSMTGEASDLRGNERFVFDGLRVSIDRDRTAYARKCAINRENGEKGAPNYAPERGANGGERGRNSQDEEKEKDESYTPPIIPPGGEGSKKPKSPKLTKAEETEQLDGLGVTGGLRAALERWLAYKREKRQSYTLTGLEALIKTAKEQADKHGADAVASVIASSMSGNYMGITWDRIKSSPSMKPLRAQNHEQRKYPDANSVGARDLLEDI